MTDAAAHASLARFSRTIARFNDVNRCDPNFDQVENGSMPHELRYAEHMSAWLDKLYPDASVELRLAVRAQHIARWQIPRNSYPMDRVGYLRWRSDLAKFHAETAGKLMREEGYDFGTIGRTQSLIRKERIKSDGEAQAVEDVACLTFLETEYVEFSGKHPDQKVISILQRTWKKMSGIGHAAALGLQFEGRALELVKRALDAE